MKRALREDKDLVIDILSKAFEDNQSVNYIVLQDHKRLRRIRSLMDYSFEVCYRFGDVWLAENRKSCALALYPYQKKTSIISIWLDIRLILQVVGLRGISKMLRRETRIKHLQFKGKMLYLWFIAVDPLYQHQGIGSRLLTEVMTIAKKKDLPICLETSVNRNMLWYQHFGFQVYGELKLSYSLYFLKRETDK